MKSSPSSENFVDFSQEMEYYAQVSYFVHVLKGRVDIRVRLVIPKVRYIMRTHIFRIPGGS